MSPAWGLVFLLYSESWIRRYHLAQPSPGKEENEQLPFPAFWTGFSGDFHLEVAVRAPTGRDAESLVPGKAQWRSPRAAQAAEVNVRAAELHI